MFYKVIINSRVYTSVCSTFIYAYVCSIYINVLLIHHENKMLSVIPIKTLTIFYMTSTSGCSIIFIFQTIILLLWVIVLFKESNRLRKKAKYSTLSSYNQDASLLALNSKVEYRKSLFLFAITLSEFFASFLIIFKLGTWIDYSINKYETVGNFSVPIFDSSTESNCSVATTSISFHWGLINHLGHVLPLLVTESHSSYRLHSLPLSCHTT